jgi:adenylate cyclase
MEGAVAPNEIPSATRTMCLQGERVRQLRCERGLTRERLSQLSQGADAVSVATLKRAEQGAPIYPGTAGAIARLLGVSLSTLIEEPRSARSDVPQDPSKPTETCGPRPRSAQATIAALPFAALGGGQRASVFADGLVEEVLHRLSGCWFPVIARCSSFSLREQPCDAKEAARILEADFLVDGTVRIHGERVRVTAQLIDADSGLSVWSNAYDERYADILALQDRLAADIVSRVSGGVLDRTVERLRGRAEFELGAYELALHGLWHFHRSTPDDNEQARAYMRKALHLAPDLSLAWYVLVLASQHDLLNQWTREPRLTLQEMDSSAREFERRVPGDPLMFVATAYNCVARGQRTEAMARLEEALELDPNSFSGHLLYGQTLAMSSMPDQGIHELELAHKLSPRDPRAWTILLTTALCHFAAERYAEAVHWAELAARKRPNLPFVQLTLASALGLQGDVSRAQAVLVRAMHDQSLRVEGVMPVMGATDKQIAERFAAGLRIAGLGGATS